LKGKAEASGAVQQINACCEELFPLHAQSYGREPRHKKGLKPAELCCII